MRVGVIQNYRTQNIHFGNLTKEEKEAFIKTKQEALDVIGHPDRSVFLYSSACLPQGADANTGTGTLLSKQGDELLDVVKTFTTANIIQDVPSGELLPKPPKNFYCAYEGSADSISPHIIEPEILMDEKFGNIITPEEFKAVVAANNGEYKDVLANFENVVEPDSPFDNMLKKAHERFMAGEGEKFDALRKEFSEYQAKNAGWLESHGIYDVLAKKYDTPAFGDWTEEVDKKLYDNDFPEDLRNARKAEILKENAKDIEYSNFKKFMADKCLGLAREKAHEKGFKFGGDVAYQFNLSDMYGNPKAFAYDVFMGPKDMKIPALDFYQIEADPINSPAGKMLAQKLRLAAERYDTLRMDVGWGYVAPPLNNTSGSYSEQKWMGTKVLDLIENTVKEVKGDKFNLQDIFYEVEADVKDFRAFNDDGSLIEPLKGRMKIYTSNYMNEGWGSSRVFTEQFKFNPAEFIYGASNRDTTPLSELATYPIHTARKADQIKELANILHMQPSVLENGDEFIRAKNAEPLLAKNHFMFFTEFFGMLRKFNSHEENSVDNFRTKIPANPEQAYYDAVKEGRAYNLMDGLEKVFKAKGFDEKHPELFAKIVEFKNKLYDIKPEVVEQPQSGGTTVIPIEEEIKPIIGETAVQTAPVQTEAKPVSEAAEAVEHAVKKNRFMKPILIIAGVLVVLYAAFKVLSRKPKAA